MKRRCQTRYKSPDLVLQARKGDKAAAATMIRSISSNLKYTQMFVELAVVGTVGAGITAVVGAVASYWATLVRVALLPMTALVDLVGAMQGEQALTSDQGDQKGASK
jgi:hypothetical protein